MRGFGLQLCLLVTSTLFLLGLLPNLKKELVQQDNGENFTPSNSLPLSSKNHDKLVLVIVDALWSGFVLERGQKDEHTSWKMPYLQSLIGKSACTYEGTVESPTVTLPRLKAIVSGIVPNFVDIVKNLRSQQFHQDNLIEICHQLGRKVVFYGDDTWIRMFPDQFMRREGTTSFFASDYVEVDTNVTKHLDKELKADDWDIMILHYLGLDHIGHVYGPRSPLIADKLLEMDAILEKIDTSLKARGVNSTIIMMGDHGMSVSGSHGGSSKEETSVPLLFIKDGCLSERKKAYRQIDVTPTVAALLGIPVPKNSLGVIMEDIVLGDNIFEPDRRVQLAFNNVKQLYDLHQGLDGSLLKDRISSLETKIKSSTSVSNEESKLLVKEALDLAVQIRDDIEEGFSDYDVYAMVFSTFVVLLILTCALLLTFTEEKPGQRKTHATLPFVLTAVPTAVHLFICSFFCRNSLVCFSNIPATTTTLILLVFLLITTSTLIMSRRLRPISLNYAQIFVVLGSVYHGVSLFSSSFVEEEHQTWYYLMPSLLLLISLQNLETGWTKTDNSATGYGIVKVLRNRAFVSGVVCVLLHRIAKHWNQTGDKWAKEPDFEDWLVDQENEPYLRLIFLISLAGTGALTSLETRSNLQKAVLSVGLMFVGIFRVLQDPSNPGDYWSIWLPRAVYILVAVLIASSAFSPPASIVPGLVLLFSLLRRPHNVPLLFITLVQARLAKQPLKVLLQYANGRFFTFVAYYWLGLAWFFYQGNSNSLARIDVAAGYIGLGSYQPVIIGFLLAISIFQGPLLSLVLYQKNVSELKEAKLGERDTLLLHLAVVRAFPLFLYFIAVIVLRHHLFIWSVFAPKLLYEIALTFFLSASAILFVISSLRQH